MALWHLRWYAAEQDHFFPLEESCRLAVRALLRIAGQQTLLFHLIGERIHVVVEADRSKVGYLGHSLNLSFRRLTSIQVGSPQILRINDGTQLEALWSRIIARTPQDPKDAHPALWSGSCLPDLIGARLHIGFNPRVLAAPYLLRLPALYLAAGIQLDGPIEPACDSTVRRLGLARLLDAATNVTASPARLIGNEPYIMHARAAIAQVGRKAGFSPQELATICEVLPQSIYRLARYQVEPELPTALRLRLALEEAAHTHPHVRPIRPTLQADTLGARQAPPLQGVRVLDLSRLLPGPFCTWLLRAQGAEVVKLEDPQGGDYLRYVPPFLPERDSKEAPLPDAGQSALFAFLNRGKKSVALDLRKDQDRESFLRILPSFDVLVESFRPGVLARLGLDPRELVARHPRLVVCSITGWGQSGPWARMPGHDINFVGLSGLLALGKRHQGLPDLPAIQAADLNGGAVQAAFAISAALFARERTGQGTIIDIAMSEGAISLVAPALASMAATGHAPEPGLDLLTGGSPSYAVYPCADGKLLTFAPLEPQFWELFCERAGVKGMTPEPKAIAALLATRTRDQWAELLIDACIAPLLELHEVPTHPQILARDVIRIHEHRVSVRPPAGQHVQGRAPAIGEHTAEILSELVRGVVEHQE